MRILVIEDDDKIASFVVNGLRQAAMVVASTEAVMFKRKRDRIGTESCSCHYPEHGGAVEASSEINKGSARFSPSIFLFLPPAKHYDAGIA